MKKRVLVHSLIFSPDGVLTVDVPSGIYNLGDDEALSTNELIGEICKGLMDRMSVDAREGLKKTLESFREV